MTVYQLKEILSRLPDESAVMIDGKRDISYADTVNVEYFSENGARVILGSNGPNEKRAFFTALYNPVFLV